MVFTVITSAAGKPALTLKYADNRLRKRIAMSSTPFNMVSLIRKKRERQSLTTEEIDYIIKSIHP